MSRFEDLKNRVNIWAESKEIYSKGNSITQINKTLEEVNETKQALEMDKLDISNWIDDDYNKRVTKEEIKDGFGDVLVTVLIGCEMQGLNPLDCLETALNVIEKRTGKMINGTFIKD